MKKGQLLRSKCLRFVERNFVLFDFDVNSVRGEMNGFRGESIYISRAIIVPLFFSTIYKVTDINILRAI